MFHVLRIAHCASSSYIRNNNYNNYFARIRNVQSTVVHKRKVKLVLTLVYTRTVNIRPNHYEYVDVDKHKLAMLWVSTNRDLLSFPRTKRTDKLTFLQSRNLPASCTMVGAARAGHVSRRFCGVNWNFQLGGVTEECIDTLEKLKLKLVMFWMCGARKRLYFYTTNINLINLGLKLNTSCCETLPVCGIKLHKPKIPSNFTFLLIWFRSPRWLAKAYRRNYRKRTWSSKNLFRDFSCHSKKLFRENNKTILRNAEVVHDDKLQDNNIHVTFGLLIVCQKAK